jgi:hypothetical protein
MRGGGEGEAGRKSRFIINGGLSMACVAVHGQKCTALLFVLWALKTTNILVLGMMHGLLVVHSSRVAASGVLDKQN